MCVMTTNVADVTKQENVELQLSPGTSFVCRPSLQETLPPRRRIPGLKPWVPGTTGLYPRPIGAARRPYTTSVIPGLEYSSSRQGMARSNVPCCRQDCHICVLRRSRHMGEQEAERLGVSQNLWGVRGRF